MKLEGKLIKIYKQTSSWICFRFEDKRSKNQYVAKGKVSGAFMPGIDIIIDGKFVDDPTYGRQIEVSEISVNGSIAATFLHKCVKGVGASLANEIVRMYGEDCINKILEDNTILLKVKGIKAKKYKMITESINKQGSISLTLSILSYFNNDITQNQIDKILHVCNSKITTFEKIKKNPYWLISHIDGFGFKKVDKLALAAGLGEFSVERIGAAIVYSLQQMSQMYGHCYSDMDALSKEVSELIIGPVPEVSKKSASYFQSLVELDEEDKIQEFIKKYDKAGTIEKWKNDYIKLIDVMCDALIEDEKEGVIVIEEERIYWKDLYDTEIKIGKIINEMNSVVPVKNIPKNQIINAIKDMEDYEDCALSEEQKNAVIRSVQNRLSIITGGPGRGKTTIIKTIINAWNDDKRIILLAPTGKAAKRITESTGYPASTIHRYKNRVKEKGYPKNKLIIVDEVSMVGIKLGLTILELAEECNLILVGDIDQLASIEPGSFMKDLIKSKKVQVSWLTKGFRNGGSIAINSDLVNQGKSSKYFQLDDDTIFKECESEEIIPEVIKTYGRLIKKYEPNEIGILSPIKSRGYGSVDSLNEAIRKEFNPNAIDKNKNASGYFENDRVMHIRNNYNKEILEMGHIETGVFNGDTGTIISINDEFNEVEILFDDDRKGFFSFEEMKNDFIPAYATTIHKAQGSQYKAVIVIMSSQHIFFLKRNLLYTAMSRAKKELILIGDKKAIAAAVRNIDDSVRNTTLKERL